MATHDIEQFVTEYVKELEAGTAAVFAGAGLSASAGFVDWATLLKPIADDLGLDVRKEQDHLVALAQYAVNSRGNNRSALHKRLLEEFPSHKTPSENHRLLARLPIPVFWTTNYDRLIERSLEDERKIPDVKITTPQLAHSKPHRDAVIYKMHGDVEFPGDAVLTKDDYEGYSSGPRAPFVTALKGDLVSRTFLFLGFSFRDPNLDYILSRIRINFQRDAREHYCITRRVQRSDFADQEAFDYASVKQKLVIDDLKRFNIKTLLIDQYSEITEILRKIETRYRRKTLFVSGSAEEFGRWEKDVVEEFLSALGRILIDKGYRIVSGFGLGISNALLSGATEQIYDQKLGHFQDYLTVRPFPRHTPDPVKRKALWTAFRRELIQQAGVAIFLFGNKSVDGKIVQADGVFEEHSIADELGLVLVPVGATGYAAETLGRDIDKRLEGHPDAYREAMQDLQASVQSPNELLSKIINMLDQINRSN